MTARFIRLCLIVGIVFSLRLSTAKAINSSTVITGSNIDQVTQTGWLSRGTVNDIEWSPDGRWFVAMASGGVWLYETGDFQRAPVPVASSPQLIVMFSPDSSLLALSDGRHLTLWNIAQQKSEYGVDVQGREEIINSLPLLYFVQDGGSILFLSGTGNSWLIDIATKKLTDLSALFPDGISGDGGDFSTDGKTLVAIARPDRTVRLLDIASKKERTVPAVPNHPDGIAISPDGQWLVTCFDESDGKNGVCFVLDTITLSSKYILNSVRDDIPSFSVDSSILILASGGHVSLWDMVNDKAIAVPESAGSEQQLAAGSYPAHVPLSANNRFAVFQPSFYTALDLESKHNIRPFIWNLSKDQIVRSLDTYVAAFSPDSKLLAYVDAIDQSIYIQDAETGKLVSNLKNFSDAISSLGFSDDGRWLATGGGYGPSEGGGSYGDLRVWNLALQERQSFMRGSNNRSANLGHTDNIESVALNPNGRLLASLSNPFSDGSIRTWDALSGIQRLQLGNVEGVNNNYQARIAFSPDGKLLAFGGHENSIQIRDSETLELLATVDNTNHCLYSGFCDAGKFAFRADGKTATVISEDGTVWQFDVQRRAVTHVFAGIKADPGCAAFNQDGKLLVFVRDDGKALIVWDIDQDRPLHTLTALTNEAICPLALNSDGTAVAVTDKMGHTNLRLWSLIDNHSKDHLLIQNEGGLGCWITAAFSPDSTLLVSADEDATIRLWGIRADF